MTRYTKSTFAKEKNAERAWGAWCRSLASRVTVAALLVGFCIVYIIQTSTLSVTGYDLGELQSTITALKHDTQRLDVEIANYRSMRSIEERVANLKLVPSTNVVYVMARDNSVALR